MLKLEYIFRFVQDEEAFGIFIVKKLKNVL